MSDSETSDGQGKVFCLAPWVHSHVHLDGKRKLCCVAESTDNPQAHRSTPFEEYWNSDLMKKTRLRMMDNDPPPECHICFKEQRYTEAPKDIFFKGYKDFEEDVLSQTDADGTFHASPHYLDYRMNDICNFSCRMCNSTTSSSIRALEVKAGMVEQNDISPEEKEKLFSEMVELIDTGQVNKIYFADGEPLLSPYHWKLINYLKEKELQKNITLTYNTNLSIFEYKGKPINEWLADFSTVYVCASIDTIGEEGEFIRSGFDWATVRHNLDRWIDFIGKPNITLIVTVTTPVLLDFKNLVKFLSAYKLPYEMVVCTTHGLETVWSPMALDRDTLTHVIEKAKSAIPEVSYFDEARHFLELLESKQVLEEQDPAWKSRVSECISYFTNIDVQRKRDKKTTVEWILEKPELEDWYSKIIEDFFLVNTEEKIEGNLLQGNFLFFHPTGRLNVECIDERARTVVFYDCLHRFENPEEIIQGILQKREKDLRLIVIDSKASPLNKLLLKTVEEGEERFNTSHYFSESFKEFSSQRFYVKKIIDRPLEIKPEFIITRDIPMKRAALRSLEMLNKLSPSLTATQNLWVVDFCPVSS